MRIRRRDVLVGAAAAGVLTATGQPARAGSAAAIAVEAAKKLGPQ